ncbi:hypothetical protein [Bacillus wiedmannii]|uniref:hypothetical protein n=1 Tax=Bacillus wiedmannii TaxID=1890302 RepID=UPI00211D6BE0|nr:hypothetical protein [Bacillus wiedmannii]MED2882183.1 hypothetical protein [Bacillus wiedmannii]
MVAANPPNPTAAIPAVPNKEATAPSPPSRAGVIAEAAIVTPPMIAAIFLASVEVCLNWALARSSASIMISINDAIVVLTILICDL